ncbi:MAG: hypothetical protein NC923_03170 [Candidatus Omnitrophica bacterium]|nr:hypothetical protein [Candidatus Omnitrophota bacterium]
MRDLVFKNLVSRDRRKRIIASSEITDKGKVRNIIRRHFIYMVKEVKNENDFSPISPYLYILKERQTREHKEKFFCRFKGSIYAVSGKKNYLILFMHSLKIELFKLSEEITP